MIDSLLAGKRVLLVEDELLIAMVIEDVLEDHGAIVVGPYGRFDDALAAAKTVEADAALLDVNLHGQRSYPVANVLEERGVPFVLISAYPNHAVEVGHRRWHRCSKPFTTKELVSALEAVLDGREEA